MRLIRAHRAVISSWLVLLMAFWQVAQPLQGATFYWDSDGNAVGNAVEGNGLGGTGTWDTTSPNWWNLTADVIWPNTFADTAIFKGAAGTITLGGAINAGSVVFDRSNFTLTGGTLTLGGPGTVQVNGAGASGATGTGVTIDSIIAGNVGLAKEGSGVLVLTNNGNSYSGATSVKNGTLTISDMAQLGGSMTTVGVFGTSTLGWGSGMLQIQGGTAGGTGLTFNRDLSLSGRGSNTINAALQSIGNNTITGDILTSAASETRIAATGGTTTINGNVYLGVADVAQLIYGNGNVVINGLIAGGTAGNLHIIKASSGIVSTLTLTNNNNSFLGATRVDGGATIRVSDGGQLGRSTSNNISPITFNSGTFEFRTDTPGSFATKNISYSSNSGTIFVDRAIGSSAALVGQTVTFGNLRQENNRVFTFNGRNGFGVTITSLSNSGSGVNSEGWTNSGNGVLTVNGTAIWSEADTTVRTLTLTATSEMVVNPNVVASGAAHILSKAGTGVLTLNGTASTYTGATAVGAGTLAIGNVGAVATTSQINLGNATTTSGALTYIGGTATLDRNILINTTTANAYINASGTGPLTLTGNLLVTVNGAKTLVLGGSSTADNTLASVFANSTGTHALQKIGTGTWVLTGANTYTGVTTVSGGTLKVQDTFAGGSRNVIADASGLTFGTDVFTNAAGGIFEYLGNGANASTETLGVLTPSAGAGTIRVTAGAGGTAALTFTSLGTVAAGSGINFVTNAGASVTLTGVANTNGILNAHAFFNGADFATGGVVGAAAYTTEIAGASLVGGNTQPYHVTTADITAQATATINAGIKFSDTRNFTLDAAQTLTLQNGAATVAGGILVTGGSTVTFAGGTGITSGGAADLVFRTDAAGDTLVLNTPILASSTGGWTKLGAGTLELGAANANTTAGFVHLNEGTVRLMPGSKLGADSIDVNLRQGATLDLHGVDLGTAASAVGSLDVLNGAGTITNTAVGTTAFLQVGSGNTASYFTGSIQDGAGKVALVKAGTNIFRLAGPQNYGGGVTLNGGTLTVNSLANFGSASGLGLGITGNNAGSLVFAEGTLNYTGSDTVIQQSTGTLSVSIDRQFTLAGNGTINSNGSYGNNAQQARAANHAALVFNSDADISFSGAGTRLLTLGGDSLGDNEIKLGLRNNGGDALAITKADGGLWILSNTRNDYSGATTISGGALRIEPSAYSINTNTVLNGGILETSGSFTRAIGTAGNEIQWTGTSNSGFAASVAPLVVNLGNGTPLTWGSTTGFSSTGQLLLNSTTALADVNFANSIDLNGALRTVNVADNTSTGTDFAIMSGVLSGAGTSGLTKTGNGLLYLSGANTYNGNTAIQAGSVAVTSVGSGGASSNFGNASGTLTLGNAGTGTTYLMYYGTGEITTRNINWNSTTGATTLDSSGSGAWVINNFTSAGNGAKTLTLRGFNTDANTISSNIGNAGGGATSVTKTDGGTWILTGNNTFTGNLTLSSGWLGLGSGASMGGGTLAIGNGGLFAAGADITINRPLSLSGNASSLYTGDKSITFTGTVTGGAASNGQVWNIYNTLAPGATLTFSGFASAEDTAADVRPLVILGTGATVFNGTIANHSAATTGGTSLSISTGNSGSLTLAGSTPNTYFSGTTLTQGTLILAKVGALGTGNFNFNGGVLQASLPLAGSTDKITNNVVLNGNPAVVGGTSDIEFGGAVTNNAGDRTVFNQLSSATLSLTGTVNLSNDATNRTLTFAGPGNTLISGVIANGGTATASALRMRGTGTLTLTGANQYDGATTVTNGVVVVSGAGVLDQNSEVTVTGIGTLRLDNSGANVGNRISDTKDLNLDGGLLDFISDGASSSETFFRLDINGNGPGRINISGGGTSTLTFGSVNFANSGSILDLSTITGLGGNNKIIFTTAPTGAAISNGILPRVVIGSDFAEHHATNGVQAFTAYNTSNNLVTAAAADTMNLTTDANISTSRAINALKLSGGGLTVGSSVAGAQLTLTSGAILAVNGAYTLNVPLLNTGANGGFFQVAAGTNLMVDSTIIGTAYTQMQGGSVSFNTKQFFNSTANLHGGTLTLNGGLNTIMPLKQSLFISPGATLDLNGNAQFVGQLTTSSDQPGGGGTVTSSTGTGTIITDNGGNWMGTIANTVNFGRVGGGTLVMSSAQSYTGWTYLTASTTTLRDDATILNTSGIDINLATLLLDNNSNLQLQNNDRLSDTAGINLRGGTLSLTGRALADATETVGAVSALMGASTITATAGGSGSYNSATLTMASLSRSAGATVNFTGTTLGQTGNSGFLKFTTAPATVGNLLLGAWAIANSTDYAAYVHGVGVGPVGTPGFTPYDVHEIAGNLETPNAGVFSSGNITNLMAQAAGSVRLPLGTTTTGLLRFGGAFTNDLAFTSSGDILHLELGGILRSNNANTTTIGTPTTRGVITSGTSELVVYHAQNTMTIHSLIQGATSLVKSGAGTLVVTGQNTYTGGTVVNQGVLQLGGDVGDVVIPGNGLTLTGATVTMLVNQGQIAASNIVTLNGSSTLTLVGANTLNSIVFNHIGGTAAPTVATGGILTLTNSNAVTVTSNNAIGSPTISGFLEIGSGAKTFNIGLHEMNGVVYDDTINPSLTISAVITGVGGSIIKSGAGLMLLSGANTFTGGVNVTNGGIVLGAGSTSGFANSLTSGPLGIGAVSMASGTKLAVNDASRVVANAFSFAGNPIFSNTGASTDTLTLNGALTFATLGTGGLVANIDTPYLNVVLGGDIQNIGSVTAIGSTGPNTISKTGPGNLSGLNLTGLGATVPINLTNLTNTSFTLLHDGDSTSGFETINLGTVTWESVNGALNLTIGRAGAGLYFPTAAYKTISLAGLNSSNLPSGIVLTNSNGYGLVIPNNITLATTNNWSVSTLNTSLQVVGLTLSGVISGNANFTKSGPGVLKLTNPGNTFTGTIDITDGLVEGASDAVFGNPANIIQIGANNAAEGLRVSGTFATSRTIHLNGASSGIDVTGGNTLTLNSPFTFATATHGLAKNDLGTLVLTQAQPGWDGVMTINQGVLRITNAGALGSTVGVTTFANVAGSLELSGGLTVAEPLTFASGDDVTSNGINGGGAVRSVDGANVLTGTILLNAASGTNDRSRAVTFTADLGASLEIQGVVTATLGDGTGRDAWIGLGGAGNGTLSTAMNVTGFFGTNRFFSINKFGTGTWTITAANAHPGTRVVIKEGTLVLSGNGSLGTPTAGQEAVPTVYLNPTGLLTLDNTTTDVDNRLSGRALNLSGADVNILGNAAGTTETVGAFTLREGLSVITLDADAGGQLNFATGALARTAGGTLLVRGDNFGSTAGAGVATMTGSAYAFIGQTGATGATNKAILPWAVGDTSLTGNGSFFLTADSATGVDTGASILRALQASEQTANFATANANVNLTTTETLAALTTINSLRLASGGGVSLNHVPLTLDSGGLITLTGNTGINGFSGVSYLTTSANRELIMHVIGDLALNVPIAGTTGAVVKSGAGTLTLAGGNAAHGTLVVNDGVLKLGGGDQTLFPGRSLILNHGGTLDLNGTVQHLNFLESRLTAVLAQSDLFPDDTGGLVQNSGASQATLVLATANTTFTGSIQGNIAVVRSQAAANFQDWNLYSEQTYTGPSLFNGGRTQLLVQGSLTNTSSIEVANAMFVLAASNATTDAQNITNRIGDTIPITLRGGSFLMSSFASIVATETIGDVTLGSGQNIIYLNEGATRVNQWDVTMASLAVTAGSRSTIRFFGIDADPNDNARLFITAAPTLSNNLIGGWAVFEREFASYTVGQGVGALNTQGYAGYSPNLINESIPADNIRIALPAGGSNTLLTANRTINSLNLQGAASSTANSILNLGGHTLTLVSGGLIASGATDNIAMSIINGNLTAGTLDVGGDLYLHTFGYVNGNTDTVNRDVNIGANIVDNGTGAVSVVYNAGDGRGTGIDGALLGESTNVTGNNTYSGGTWINAGRVILNNPDANGTSTTATGSGNVTISGGPSTLGNSYQEYRTSLVFGASNQIARTATINLVGSGRLSLNNFNQTVANIVFDNIGGHNPEITTGTGTLSLTGDTITASGQNASTNAISTITGRLELLAPSTNIIVNPVQWNGEVLNPILPNLLISASIEGGNIIKAGNGVLRLSGANAFTGVFDLQQGGLSLGGNNALSTGTLIIGNNTFLTSTADNIVTPNAYTVSGNFSLRDAFNLTLSGAGTLTAGAHTISVELTQRSLTLSGVLGGAGASLNKAGDGILVLGNSNNTYNGATTVSDGVLRYGAVNAVPVGSAVTVLEGGMLDITLGGTAVTVGSLAGNSPTQGGLVYHGGTTGVNTLTVGGDNTSTSFGGVIANAAGSTLNLVKAGSGTFTLGGANSYNGSTTVQNGRLVARAVGGASPLGTSQSLIMGGGSTSGILQLGDSSAPLNHTFTSLSSQGTGTLNQIVSGNAAMATLTLDLATTSVFRGNIGGAGPNEGNLNLVKSGVGDLTISGTGNSTYSGTTTVTGGKLFMDTPGAFSTATSSLTLADGTEFSLRGTTNAANQVYGFSGTGNKITVGSTTGATLGFGIDGAFNSQLNLAAGQTMTVNGSLTTAVYVNSAPIGGQKYVLINGTDAGSLQAGGGTFNLNPVIFNGGSFSYTLQFDSGVNGGGLNQWVLIPTAVAAAENTWWKGDLTGLGAGVWSATTTSGAGFPSNWDTDQTSGIDAVVPPDSGSIVHFSATGASNFATTLGANLTIQELIFHTGNVATSIGSSNGINTLTLGNATDASGLTIQAGANNVSISAIVAVAKNQSWNINDTGRLLTLSGGLTGTAVTLTVNDTATNAGNLLFSGSAASMTGTLAMNAGLLIFEDTGSLNSGLNVVLGTATKAATLQVGGSTEATLATIGGLSNGAFLGSKVVAGSAALSTLAIGPATGSATFSGALGGAGTNENQFNLEKTGAGIQILNGAATYSGTTVVRNGTLQLGAASTFAPTGALSVIANAGATAIFDFNGKSFTTVGNLTLGGGAGGIARVLDTNATKGVLTLGGNIIYDAANNPGDATISANINTGGANRVITVGNSTGSTNELTISGTISAVTDNNLTFNGAGSGTITGNILLAWSGGTGATNDVVFASTGTWTIGAKIEVEDDIIINSGVVNANAIESLDATDDVVITGTGTQGSTIVNINAASQVHTGDDFFIRGGAIVNVNTTNGINTGTDQLLIGDSGSASAAAAGVLNLNASMATANGFVLGAASGNIGNITGTGTFTSANTKFMRNGSIDPGIILAGNGAITKDTTGTVTFSGSRATASTGATNIQEGNLILDYSVNNLSKIGGVLNLGAMANVAQPTLTLNGSSTATTAQTVGSTAVIAGNTTIAINNGTGQTASLALGAITRVISTTAGGGIVNFEYSSTDAKATSTSPAGTLGWATVSINSGVERFAAINGVGDIVQATMTTQNDVTQWGFGQNIINSGAFTGAVDNAHISSLTFNAPLATTVSLSSTGHLLLGSGGIMVDPAVGAFNSTIQGGRIYGATSGILGEIIVHQNNAFGTLTIASQIVNAGGITKTGTGVLVLSGNNSYVSGTGTQVSVNEGTLRVTSGNAIGDTTSVYIRQGATLDLANSNEVVGHLVTNSTGTIALGTGDITLNQTASSTYAGVFTGIAGSVITVNSAGFNFNLTGSTTTGFIGTVVINSGLFQLSGASARLNGATAFTLNKGANILIDNNDDSAPNDRISETATFTLNSADGVFSGETRPRGLALRSDNNGNESEGIGALTFNSGASYASLEASGGASSQNNLTAANWTRLNFATMNVRGRTLGGAAANNSTQFKILDGANEVAFLASTNLVGGGAVTGASNKNISIVPWAIGENLTGGLADTNMGNTLVTYVDNRGLVPLDLATEYATYAAAGAQDNTREVITASLTGLTGKTLNSFVIHNDSTAASTLSVSGAGAGNTLINSSGAFLFTLNPAAAASSAHKVTVDGFDGGIQTGANNEYIFWVVNPSSATTTPTLTATISSPLNSATAAVTKSGRGTLEFTGVNIYSGGTTVNEGILLIHDNDNIGSGGLALAGGVLSLATDYTDDLGGRNLVVHAGGGTLEVQGTGIISTNLVTSGTGTLTKMGAGTLQIAGGTANTHTGDFAVTRGLVELNKTAAINAISGANLLIGFNTAATQPATVRLLAANQIANTTNVSLRSLATDSVATLDLNGLAETIGSLTMGVTTSSGVLVTTGATGVLTLGGDITINSDRAFNDAGTNARNVVITGTGSIGTAAPNTGTLNLGGVTRTITVQSANPVATAGNNDATIETAIASTGSAGIIKEGSRALILSGNNTYTGTTVVNSGEINLRGSLGTGAVTVSKVGATLANAAVLSGGGDGITTGIIRGSVTIGDINDAGILAPGTVPSTTTLITNYGAGANGMMTLTAGGTALTVADGSQIQLGITSATYNSAGVAIAIAGSSYTNALTYIGANDSEFTTSWNVAPASTGQMDFLNLIGASSSLSIGNRATATFGDGSIRISLVGTPALAMGDVFNLIDWQAVSTINGNFDTGGNSFYSGSNIMAGDLDLPSLSAGLAWDVSAFARYGVLVIVPEPSRALLLLLGLLGLMLRRRRR